MDGGSPAGGRERVGKSDGTTGPTRPDVRPSQRTRPPAQPGVNCLAPWCVAHSTAHSRCGRRREGVRGSWERGGDGPARGAGSASSSGRARACSRPGAAGCGGMDECTFALTVVCEIPQPSRRMTPIPSTGSMKLHEEGGGAWLCCNALPGAPFSSRRQRAPAVRAAAGRKRASRAQRRRAEPTLGRRRPRIGAGRWHPVRHRVRHQAGAFVGRRGDSDGRAGVSGALVVPRWRGDRSDCASGRLRAVLALRAVCRAVRRTALAALLPPRPAATRGLGRRDRGAVEAEGRRRCRSASRGVR